MGAVIHLRDDAVCRTARRHAYAAQRRAFGFASLPTQCPFCVHTHRGHTAQCPILHLVTGASALDTIRIRLTVE